MDPTGQRIFDDSLFVVFRAFPELRLHGRFELSTGVLRGDWFPSVRFMDAVDDSENVYD